MDIREPTRVVRIVECPMLFIYLVYAVAMEEEVGVDILDGIIRRYDI